MTTQQAAKTIRYESAPTRHITAAVTVPGHEVATVSVASHEVQLGFLRMSKDGFIVMGLTPCGLYEVVLRPG